MKPERLIEIRKLVEKATPIDKWKRAEDWYHDCSVGVNISATEELEEADCKLVSESRTIIPELLSAVESLREENEKLRGLANDLAVYAKHDSLCYWLEHEDKWHCKCGLPDKLEQLKTNKEKGS